MNSKISVLLLAVAIIAAAISAFITVQNRKEIAINVAHQAASEEEKALAEERTAKANQAAKDAEAKAKADALAAETKRNEAAKLERENQAQEKANLAVKAKAAADEAKAAADKAKAASDARATAEAELRKAKEVKDAEQARVKKAEADAAKAQALKEKAEAESLKIKHSLNELYQLREQYEIMIAEAEQAKRELEELKNAYKPEKTIEDLTIVGSEAENEKKAKGSKAKLLPEDDPKFTLATRKLSRAERLGYELHTNETASIRKEMTATLEKLLKKAADEGRVIDAQFYFKTLKGLYPDWTLETETNKTVTVKEAK